MQLHQLGQMNRIHALDGLRGVAAIAVVIYHLAQVRLCSNLFPHGYLAVDFFFVLSGFVVARAYEPRVLSGMRFGRFLAVRAVRLMPLSTLGALAGFCVLFAKWVWYPDKVDELWQIVVSGMLNVVLLPTPFGGVASRHELFPGNGPLWSLFFEVVANVAWVTWFVRWRTKSIAVAALALGVGFAVAVASLSHANFGWDFATSWFGLLRVGVGFLIGVVIHKHLPQHVEVRGKFTTCGLAALLAGLLAMPIQSPLYDMTCVLMVFPALVALSATVVVADKGEQRWWAALGDLSYPLYVLHFPILLVASGVSQAVGAGLPPWAFAAAALVTSSVAAWFALRLYDEPVRARLLAFLNGETRQHRRAGVRPNVQRSGHFLVASERSARPHPLRPPDSETRVKQVDEDSRPPVDRKAL